MPDHPENQPDERPIQGQVRYSQVSARVPEEIGEGVFATAAMVMTGPFETVLDFILRLSEKPRVVARIVLPPPVVGQFVQALQRNIGLYEQSFGPLPRPPQFRGRAESAPSPEESADTDRAPSPPGMSETSAARSQEPPWTTHVPHPELAESAGDQPARTNIEQIYDDLRLPDSMLSGRYANAVLIRHTATEFCFDFITNIFPRSAVSSRVYLSAANVGPLLESLQRSVSPHRPSE